MAAPLTYMLQTTNDFVVNKLKSKGDIINRIGSGKVIVEVNSKRFQTGFFILGVRLAFAKLRQAFSTTLILHYIDLKYQI